MVGVFVSLNTLGNLKASSQQAGTLLLTIALCWTARSMIAVVDRQCCRQQYTRVNKHLLPCPMCDPGTLSCKADLQLLQIGQRAP
jgi:hypothetical protein